MKRILGIGDALVDILTRIDNENLLKEFELPKGSMQLVDKAKSDLVIRGTSDFKRIWSGGGSAANTIYGLAMLGVNTGFIGAIGRDETGDLFEEEMKNAGVHNYLVRRDSVTGTAVTLITPDYERTFATHLGAAVELYDYDLNPELFEGYDILYLEGYLITNYPLIETACRLAKERKMLVALDLASYNVVELNPGSFHNIIKNYTDVLFANEHEARALTGLEPEKALDLLSGLCEITVLKVGADGSRIKRSDRTIAINSFPVKCNDTTGAGDLYASGFLYGFSRDLDLEKCGLIGSYLAGKIIEIVGARLNFKEFTEVKKEIAALIAG